MTRKDYEKFALLLREEERWDSSAVKTEVIENIAFSMVEIFTEDNPNFNADRFLEACGVK